jgi:hypothetical protein
MLDFHNPQFLESSLQADATIPHNLGIPVIARCICRA